MRKALNENPVVQFATLGVVAIIFAVLLFTTVLKKEEVPVTDPAAAVDPAAPAPATVDPAATTADPATTPPEAAAPDPAAEAPAPAGAAPVTPDPAALDAAAANGLIETDGLPKEIVTTYAQNKPIALLVVDPKGIADRKLDTYTKRLSKGGVEVFVVKAKNVADYSRITAGVAVTRTPALIVIRPRKLTDNVPTATVSYGFRSPRSVEQALDDALYKGNAVAAYP